MEWVDFQIIFVCLFLMLKLLFLIWDGGVSGMGLRVGYFSVLENLKPRAGFIYGLGGWGFGWALGLGSGVVQKYLAVNGDADGRELASNLGTLS